MSSYAFSDTMSVKFGYRHLETKYSADNFEIDNAMHG